MKTNIMKTILTTVTVAIVALLSNATIPMAGIYEGSDKDFGSNRKMYVVLDFVKGTPDFTQQFTTKESKFKLLPADFMNAKKISRAFAGTTAAGFSRYRHKMLFSSWEEMKLTNPRLKEGGVILCDWVDTENNEGTCAILRLPNDSITIYGLSSLDPLLSPNGLRLELVKSLLPEGTQEMAPLTADAIASAKDNFTTDCNGYIENLKNKPDVKPAPQNNSVTPETPAGESKDGDTTKTSATVDNFPILWRDNGAVQYEYEKTGEAGSYGKYGIRKVLDFWPDETVKGQDIACRQYTNTAYANGRLYEEEYIYYGHREGNRIVFTHRFDSFSQGYEENPQIEKLAKPIVMTVASNGKDLIFQDCRFVRTY